MAMMAMMQVMNGLKSEFAFHSKAKIRLMLVSGKNIYNSG